MIPAGFILEESFEAYLRSKLFKRRCSTLIKRKDAGKPISDKEIAAYLGVSVTDLIRWAEYKLTKEYLQLLMKRDRPIK